MCTEDAFQTHHASVQSNQKNAAETKTMPVRRNPLLVHIWAVDRAGVEGIDTADGKQSSLQSQLQLRNPE